ncbi:MAG: transcriptional activator NhaR [Phycisphaerales bacterium]|nr:MAG: transcriptional activator NhaR [Phycisphaerales bacterium]
MEWLNYHHLLYFWVVAKEGTIAAACAKLHVAQPTISAQLRVLEKSLGEKLFTRVGRNLALTETGRVVYRYADEIFSLGRDLMDTLKGRPTGRALRLSVGVADVLPKLVAYRLLEPAFQLPEPVQVVCHEGNPAELLTRLATYELDLVLSDSPIGPDVKVRAFNHLLGECSVSIFGTKELATKYRPRFPGSLDGAPFIIPTGNTALRRAIERWLDSEDIRPSVVAEFEDSALLKVFGQAGKGLFAAPTVIEKEVQRQYSVRVVGRVESVRERFYAISVEKKVKHPAVVAIADEARQKLFG